MVTLVVVAQYPKVFTALFIVVVLLLNKTKIPNTTNWGANLSARDKKMRQQHTSKPAACVILLICILATNEQLIKQVQCDASKKFLAGFLIAILLGK